MDGKMLARLAAVILVAVAVTAAAIHLAREEKPAARQAPPATASDTPLLDPLREALRRCQRMGKAATRDADCLAAWDENRRRFLSPAGAK